MRIIRYVDETLQARLAAVTDQDEVYTLGFGDFQSLLTAAEDKEISASELISSVIEGKSADFASFDSLRLLVPLHAPEVWAAGVTYERSREARNYEATGGKLDSTTFYDKVYDAERPELFFKATGMRTVGPGGEVWLRSDSNWQIPEPELGLVINAQGKIVGYTAGNDMSCRDIEGENPLYLPQAKVWKRSCAFGPAVRLAETVEDPYNLNITCRIIRDGLQVFEGSANTGQLKRRFKELVSYLMRDNEIDSGTVLLTGTCIVPPNEFTLRHADRIEIEIESIGTLVNSVNGNHN